MNRLCFEVFNHTPRHLMKFHYEENNDRLLGEKVVCFGSKFQANFVYWYKMIMVKIDRATIIWVEGCITSKVLS